MAFLPSVLGDFLNSRFSFFVRTVIGVERLYERRTHILVAIAAPIFVDGGHPRNGIRGRVRA
jgi:hypothetical protein